MSDHRWARLAVLVLIGLVYSSINGYASSEAGTPTPTRPGPLATATPMPTITPAAIQERQVITVEAEGLVFNYSQGFYWDEERFDREYKAYSEDKASYLKDFVGDFSKDFLESANLEATDWKVSFISEYELEAGKAAYFALFQCRIRGTASGTAERPTFRSEWLLRPLFGSRPDLYDFEQPTDRMLIYEGEVDHTPITITLRFPKPINHCHYHVWYER